MDFLLLFVLLGLSAAFSGTETAFFSLSKVEIARLEAGSRRTGSRVVSLIRRPHDLLSALLIGNLLVNTAASIVATSICLRWFGARGLAVAVVATTLALLVLGEITPKLLALRFRGTWTVMAQGPLSLWLTLNTPLVRTLGRAIEALLVRLPWDRAGTRTLTTDELEAACDLAVADGTLSETEGHSLARLLRLEDLDVGDIMTPRTSVVTLRRGISLAELLEVARRSGYNRYPVLPVEGHRPEGLFHLKELLSRDGDGAPLDGPLRPLYFVPESKGVAALLAEMRRGAGHLAAVVDEHGDFAGIVTMADCLQALLGQVADTALHDVELVPLGDGRWVIDGRTDLRVLEEVVGLKLPPSRDYVTVTGFLMARLGRVLQPGDRVTLPAARLTVLEMTDHRVERIQVTLRSEPEVET